MVRFRWNAILDFLSNYFSYSSFSPGTRGTIESMAIYCQAVHFGSGSRQKVPSYSTNTTLNQILFNHTHILAEQEDGFYYYFRFSVLFGRTLSTDLAFWPSKQSIIHIRTDARSRWSSNNVGSFGHFERFGLLITACAKVWYCGLCFTDVFTFQPWTVAMNQ